MRRFRVSEESMLPTLRPGDVIIAAPEPHPAIGSIVVFPSPRDSGMWLVKRVGAYSDGEAWLESDNPDATNADSRTLGWVGTETMHRAVIRYRPPLSLIRL
jgi:phage repressor protein C with HTH and peptisase S24 domain